MKKQLSFLLLAINIFSFNVLPAQAMSNKNDSAMSPGQWCFEMPWMGLFCFYL
ncbi:hypothetical protein IQ255_11550 [Pleurocapsales cyanobacterium LEGE 10410]|nr:hypothetical protein [Pleurocapsales cyanobacterium LEGE 10410]